MKKPGILVLIDWYAPGFKAGGPVRSMVNMIDHLCDQVAFHVVTTDTDYTGTSPYPGITSDAWTTLPDGTRVWYASRKGISRAVWRTLLNGHSWDAVYINGMWSPWFSAMPLWLLRGSSVKRIVAVRGMLARGMMNHVSLNKRLILAAMKLAGCYKNVVFQATNTEEMEDVKRWISADAVVHLVPNLGRKAVGGASSSRVKRPGELQLVSVARIAVEKNTLFAIECLAHVRGRVSFDLYGPIYDEAYWAKCREAIARLPEGINVTHKGTIAAEDVPALFAKYHALFMPSLGENFGHSMVEALATGLPLLISDRTPWRGLAALNAGWDLSLEDPGGFRDVLNDLVMCDQAGFDPLSKGAFALGERYLNDPAPVRATLELLLR